MRTSGQRRAVQLQRNVRDGDLPRKHRQYRPRSAVRDDHATKTRTANAESHRAKGAVTRYTLAEVYVTVYLQSAAGATTFVPPAEWACIFYNMTYTLKC